MGGDDAVLCLQQGVVTLDGLGAHHVQAGGIDLAGVQRVRQVLLYHQGTPGVVQQNDPVLHLGDGVLIDDALGGGEQGAVQGDDIGGGQQGIQVHIFRDGPAGVVGVAVVGQDLHAHGLGDGAGLLADAAKADDAHSLPRQLNEGIVPEAPVGAALPLALVDHPVVVADVVADFQQQANGELAHGIRAVGGDIADYDAPFLGVVHVNHIVARGQNADEFQVGTGIHNLPVHRGLVGVNRLGIPDSADNLGVVVHRGPVIDPQLPQRLQPTPAQVPGVFRIAVQYNDFHRNQPPVFSSL